MSLETYRLIHFLGIFLTIISVGSITHHVLTGGTKQSDPFRKGVMMTHGIGMLLVLVGGFGALAKFGMHGMPPLWAILKLVIWLIFGALVGIIYKKPGWARGVWIAIPVLALIASALAAYKPM